MHILIVEDDAGIAELVALYLRELPADTTRCDNGWQGLDLASSGKFDLVVLDVMLPGINGVEVCRKLRTKLPHLPILMLTAKADEQDKILGLETGADDYLTKPFSGGELLARIKAIIRRARRESVVLEQQLVRLVRGELVMDLEKRTVQRGAVEIDLTVKEFELLQLFMQNPGRSYSRRDILDLIWGEQFEGLEHTVNSHVNRLRMKVEEDAAAPKYILTAWGTGYKFADV
jgi:two-component system, OmpR family, alkaline phosphatase synthesis response regulator PhoP